MHSSGSMTRKFGPTWKQSTGQTSTQSMYLHLMQFSVTTKVIAYPFDLQWAQHGNAGSAIVPARPSVTGWRYLAGLRFSSVT